MSKTTEVAQTRALLCAIVDSDGIDGAEYPVAVEIVEAAEAYYLGEPIISDEEFDALVEELRALNPNHPVLTQVGWGISVYGEKVSLPAPIRHSLDKVTGIENLSPMQRYRTSLKIDGMTCILQYVGGELKLAATRGDGQEGVNITPKMSRIRGVPMKLKEPVDIIVRGELFISLSEFEENLAEEYANPRASVAGFINRKSFDGLEYVQFVGHPENKKPEISDDFIWVPEAWNMREGFEWWYKQNSFYPTDGIVCSGDNFEDIFAFKFATERVTTRVTRVEYNMKRGGKLVPVIHYNPVKLYGTVCRKCTGFNYQYIVDNNIGPGAEIELTKANEIIPYITRVLRGVASPQLPVMEHKVEGVHAYVLGDVQYELSLKHFIEHHFCFDGFKRPEIIMEALGVKTFDDLSEWRNPIMAGRIIDALAVQGVKALADKIAEKITEGPLNEKDFFRQFAYDGLGEKASEALQPFIQPYMEAISGAEQAAGPEFDGRITIDMAGVNATVRNILSDAQFQNIVKEARQCFEWEYRETRSVVNDGEIKATFIITGSLASGRSKKQFADFVAPYGYKMVTTAKQANIIIGNPASTTAKAEYAKKNGIPLLTEAQFLEKYLEGVQ